MELSTRFLGVVVMLAALATLNVESVEAAGPSSAYEARNMDFSNATARAAHSGQTIFDGDFSARDSWKEVNNYNNKLELEFGAGENSSELVVKRVKPVDENEAEAHDTAWSVATDVRAIEEQARGREFILRIVARSSKRIEGSGNDGKTWHGAITWFNDKGEEIESTPVLFSSVLTSSERRLEGTVPENASGFVVRIGFDSPNLEPDEYAVVSKASLEIVDSNRPYAKSGDFLSGVYRGPAKITASCAAPDDTAITFELYAAEEADGIPGEFKLVATSQGTGQNATCSLETTAPFFRYRALLTTDGVNTPTLKEVRVGGKVESGWTDRGDAEPPRVKLVGARATPDPDPRAPVAFILEDASIVRLNSVTVAVDDEDATARFRRVPDVDGNVAFEEQGDQDYAPGLHKVVVTASDVYENSVVATRYFLVGDVPDTPKITLRDDGVTLIDGEPFFPIGIYGVMEREFNGNNIDEAFRGLKEAGFNFAHSYSMPRTDRFVQAAEKYGFKLWSVARFPDERFVEVERFSPAIIAWYLGDDTSYNTTPEELDDYFFSVKAVDPTRITVQADPIDAAKEVSNYRPYVAGTDAFLPEIYPVRKEGAESGYCCVAQTALDVRQARADAIDANDGPKAIWPIIQYFQGWGWERFPTYPELRGMSFAALAAGANGITWYTYGGTVEPEQKKFNYGVTTSPERWKNISTIATQINELSPVLLQPSDPSAQPKASVVSGPSLNLLGNESIVCLLKRHEDKTWLIAVNTTHEEVEARFEFPTPQDAGAPETLYDEKDVSQARFVEGALIDKFEPFGVRIWRW